MWTPDICIVSVCFRSPTMSASGSFSHLDKQYSIKLSIIFPKQKSRHDGRAWFGWGLWPNHGFWILPHSNIKVYWRLVGRHALCMLGKTLCGALVSINLCKCVCVCVCACARLSKQEAIYGKFRIGEAKCVSLPPVSLFYSSSFYFWSGRVTIEWLVTCKESELVPNEPLRQNKQQAACREEEGTKSSLRLSDDRLIFLMSVTTADLEATQW